MNKLASYLRPVHLLCLLSTAHYFQAQWAAPLAAFAKDPATGKAPLLRRPATGLGRLAVAHDLPGAPLLASK